MVRALAISFLLHFLLLWPDVPAWRDAVPVTLLVASLRPSAAPVAPPADTHAKSLATERPARPATEQAAVAMARPSDTPETHQPAMASTVAAPEGSADNPANRDEAPAAAVSSALPPTSGFDADSLRSYRLALAREARRYRRYPERAIEAGWEGTAELRVSVGGHPGPSVQLARSSGHAELDEAALEMLRRAVPATPLPAPLQAREFSINLPIVFELPQ